MGQESVSWQRRNTKETWHDEITIFEILSKWYPERVIKCEEVPPAVGQSSQKIYQKWNKDLNAWVNIDPTTLSQDQRDKLILVKNTKNTVYNSNPSAEQIASEVHDPNFKNVFFPILDRAHFRSMFRNLNENNFFYFNSMGRIGQEDFPGLNKAVGDYLNTQNENSKGIMKLFRGTNVSYQKDGSSCGDFSIIPLLIFLENNKSSLDKTSIEEFILKYGGIENLRKINTILGFVTKDTNQKELEEYVATLNKHAAIIVNAHLKRIGREEVLDENLFKGEKVEIISKPGYEIHDISPLPKSTSSVECSVNLPTDLKNPDPVTGKTFKLLTKESIDAYQTVLKDVATFEWKEKDKCLLIKPNDNTSTIEVYSNHMTLPNPTESGLKIMADAYMTAIEEAMTGNSQVKKELWIDADEKATKFLSDYCSKKGYTIVDKPAVEPKNKVRDENKPNELPSNSNTQNDSRPTMLKF